jgi:hypothetical protein
MDPSYAPIDTTGIETNYYPQGPFAGESPPPPQAYDPYEPNKERSSQPKENQQQNGVTYHSDVPPGAVVVLRSDGCMDGANLFHIVGIICALLALIITPLVELVPMVMWCCVHRDLRNQTRTNIPLHVVHFFITLIVFCLWIFLITFLSVLSWGIILPAFLIMIPMAIVLVELWISQPTGARRVVMGV